MQHVTYQGRHLCTGRKVPQQVSACPECARKMSVLMGVLRSLAEREGPGSEAEELLSWLLAKQEAGCPLPF